MFCETDIYHPNINTRHSTTFDGASNVCLNLLDSGTWDRKYGLEGVVLGIVYLLHHPNLSSPLYGLSDSWEKETFEENVTKYMRGESVAGRKFTADFLKGSVTVETSSKVHVEQHNTATKAGLNVNNAVTHEHVNDERLLKTLEELGVSDDTVASDETYEEFVEDIRAQITELERSESVESIDSAGSGVEFDERGNDRWSYHYGRDNSYDSTVCGQYD